MTISAPPRPPEHERLDELERLADELRLLIEEARRRARRRRQRYAAVLVLAVGATMLALFRDGGADPPTLEGSPADAAGPAAGTRSASSPWISASGLNGGLVLAVAADPTRRRVLYAGTREGVFKSVDGAGTWRRAGSGLGILRVDALAVDPVHPATVYAGTADGVYKSIDGGRSWRLRNTGIPLGHDPPFHRHAEGYVAGLAVDPKRAQNVYAGKAWSVYRSDEGGRSWHELHPPAGPWSLVGRLTIDPRRPETVYASARNRIFRSTNRGASWQALAVGSQVWWLGLDPSDSRRLWAGGNDGLYESRDGGRSWARRGSPSRRALSAFAVDPATSGTLYAAATRDGIYKTEDGGLTWQRVRSVPGRWDFVNQILVDPKDSSLLYAFMASDVLKSDDAGTTWRAASRGLDATTVSALAFDANRPGTMLAAAGRVFTSADDGHTWRAITEGVHVVSVTIVGGRYLAGTDGHGLLASDDRGATWHTLTMGLPATVINCLAVDPGLTGTVYAGTGRGLFVSADGGSSWRATQITKPVWSLAVDPAARGRVYAGTASGGVWRTGDNGATWQLAQVRGRMDAIAVDPQRPDRVYAASGFGVFRSSDGGVTWARTARAPIPAGAHSLAVDPLHADALYAGTVREGVFSSRDGGASWTGIGPAGISVGTLAIDPTTRTLYAGTFDAGLRLLRLGP